MSNPQQPDLSIKKHNQVEILKAANMTQAAIGINYYLRLLAYSLEIDPSSVKVMGALKGLFSSKDCLKASIDTNVEEA